PSGQQGNYQGAITALVNQAIADLNKAGNTDTINQILATYQQNLAGMQGQAKDKQAVIDKANDAAQTVPNQDHRFDAAIDQAKKQLLDDLAHAQSQADIDRAYARFNATLAEIKAQASAVATNLPVTDSQTSPAPVEILPDTDNQTSQTSSETLPETSDEPALPDTSRVHRYDEDSKDVTALALASLLASWSGINFSKKSKKGKKGEKK
ncbi:hypothetical protein, partial [Fructobacillus ficulneus]